MPNEPLEDHEIVYPNETSKETDITDSNEVPEEVDKEGTEDEQMQAIYDKNPEEMYGKWIDTDANFIFGEDMGGEG